MPTDVVRNIKNILEELEGTEARLVAVSKTKPIDLIEQAYAFGQRIFGENKVQELVHKQENLPQDIQWHMIGHLQRNKVKYIAPFVNLIHGVDTLKLLREINKEGKKNDRVIDCLLQVHIAKEDTKFGLSADEIREFFDNSDGHELTHVKLKGLMGMATNTDDESQISSEFESLKALYKDIKATYHHSIIDFQELSMGMSGDYHIALRHGATLIRLGSSIFGARDYSMR